MLFQNFNKELENITKQQKRRPVSLSVSQNSDLLRQKKAWAVCCTTSDLTSWMNNSSIVSLISLCRATIVYLAVDCGFWCDIHFFFLFSDI